MAKDHAPSLKQDLFFRVAAVVFLMLTIGLSCHKELSCEGCVLGNQPPVAVAGQNYSFSLPIDSFLLDGTLSKDPDGEIIEWQWRKISGPDSFFIQNSGNSIATVRDPGTGVYEIELSVKDDGGLFGTDTVRVEISTPAIFSCTDYR